MRRLLLLAGWLLGSGSGAFAQSAPLQRDGIKLGYEVFHHWCVDCHGVGTDTGAMPPQPTGAVHHVAYGCKPFVLGHARAGSD